MLKKFLGLGILICLISSVNATGFPSNENFSQNTKITTIAEELSTKIANDNAFMLYYVSSLEFGKTLIESKAVALFDKYVHKTITKDEESVLFGKFNFTNKEEFDAIGIKLSNELSAFVKKFPELRLLQEKERKEVLINAMKSIKFDNAVSVKFSKLLSITYYDCFSAYIACVAGCFIACSGQPDNTCVWTCEAVCAGLFSLCYVLVDE